MKSVVTGGTGFVGSHIARALVDAGHSVRILHRPTSRLDALADIAGQYESALGDINDFESLCAAFAGCGWVFHVAAVADYWRADREKMFEANVEGTRRVLLAAREAGVKRVIFTSSAAAVGLHEDGQPSDETMPFNYRPERFPYGHSKWLAEQVVREAVEAGQEVVTLNPVVILGPGDLNVISGDFVLKIKRLGWLVPVTSGGIAVTDVRDVARAHLAAARQGRVGERYIVGTANYPLPAWYALIADAVGAPRPGLPLPDWSLPPVAALIDLLRAVGIHAPIDGNQTRLGARKIYFAYDKAWSELGKPLIDMRQSLADTYGWYRDHGYVEDDRVTQLVARVGKWL